MGRNMGVGGRRGAGEIEVFRPGVLTDLWHQTTRVRAEWRWNGPGSCQANFPTPTTLVSVSHSHLDLTPQHFQRSEVPTLYSVKWGKND